MLIERVLYPVETLGPGKRIGIWTSGCSKKCFNCISPEMQTARADKDIPVSQLIQFTKDVMRKNHVNGITISGGDPLEQPDELLAFISAISADCEDILIYTGYTLSELQKILPEEKMDLLKKHTAVLIDGRYQDNLNDNISPLTGSVNQKINFFNAAVKNKYEKYMNAHGRKIQNIFYGDKIISIGIHKKEL